MTKLSDDELAALRYLKHALDELQIESIDYDDDDGRDGPEIDCDFHTVEVFEDCHDFEEIVGVTLSINPKLPGKIENQPVMATVIGVEHTTSVQVSIKVFIEASDGTEINVDDDSN